MGADEYTSTGSGGLKLKGVKDSRVDKKHKKKKNKDIEKREKDGDNPKEYDSQKVLKEDDSAPPESQISTSLEMDDSTPRKTEAEKRHEELRRRRLDERLKREGVKTHKERVEELNRYLSGLSEHHDMPRIGPG